MKKLTMMALSIIAIANLLGCATAETKETAVKAETPQTVDAPKVEAPKVMETQKKETEPVVGKRGFKLPDAAATDKPAAAGGKPDKAKFGQDDDCEGVCLINH